MKPIEQVLAEHTEALMAVPGVVGTAIGASGIRVFVLESAARPLIPDRLEGYAVSVEVTGPILPRQAD